MIGEIVSHYKISSILGTGGMGDVYLASDLELDREVAIKFLTAERSRDEESRQRFLREAKAQAMLSHPNIATFHEVGQYDGRPYIIMEYVAGQPLNQLATTEKLSLTDILDLVIQVAEGLQASHAQKVIHRDVKPQNLLVTSDRRVKITDFGLAHWKGATTLTREGTRLGTAYYMSPEQAEGKRVDHRSDIFSLGIVLYELLCNQRPFEGDSEATVLYDLLNSQPPPLARFARDMPEDMERIVQKCLEKSPDDRYQSAADLVTDLRAVRRDSGASGASGIKRRARRRFPSRAVIFAVGLAVILVAVLAESPLRRRVYRWTGIRSVPAVKCIAVIPFVGVGDASDSQTFRDGLIETLTSKLTQLERFEDTLWVIPASEVRETGVTSVRRARQAFDVTLAVTGSVQRVHDRLRITMNLVDAKSERQLGSTVLDYSSEDIWALQDTAVIVVADLLELQLQPDARRVLKAGGTMVFAANDAYLRGQAYIQRYDQTEAIDSALGLFELAIERDPEFAMAYVAYADACWNKYNLTGDAALLGRGEERCRHAIRLNDALAPPHVSLGFLLTERGEYEQAEEEFNQALARDPASQRAYRGLGAVYEALHDAPRAETTYRRLIERSPGYWFGYRDLQLFLLRQGRIADALAYMDTVVALDPQGFRAWNDMGAMYLYLNLPDKARATFEHSLEIAPNYAAYSNLGTLSYLQGDYPSAALMYENARDLEDEDYQVWINLASAYYWTEGRRAQALATYRRAAEMAEAKRATNPRDPSVLSHLAESYAMLDEDSTARVRLAEALNLAPDNIEVMLRAGVVYEMLGERDWALDWIKRALERGYPIAYIEKYPELAELRADPRFKSLQHDSGMP